MGSEHLRAVLRTAEVGPDARPRLVPPAVMNLVTALFGPGAKITFCTGQTNYPGCERQEWCAPATPPHHIHAPRLPLLGGPPTVALRS